MALGIIVQHAGSSTIEDVGFQLWSGSLLMVDFLLHMRDIFTNECILELGCGIGRNSSATFLKRRFDWNRA
jgi:hypothetical protein